jgi:hypothetical protein
MTAIQLFDALSTRLERLQHLNILVDQLDALCFSLELILADQSVDEAELERQRLAAYVSMIREHNARQEAQPLFDNNGSNTQI